MQAITIITPCYNENITLISFLDQLKEVLKDLKYNFNVVVVSGTVQYIITPSKNPQVKSINEPIPFIRFDPGKFFKKKELEGYIIFEYQPDH